jgi:hypothetical protein
MHDDIIMSVAMGTNDIPLTSTTSMVTITVAMGQISSVAIVKITHIADVLVCSSVSICFMLNS